MSLFYTDKHCTLYHGDCLQVLAELPPDSVDAVVTDPPYGIGDKMQGGTWGSANKYSDFRSWDVAPNGDVMQCIIAMAKQHIIWGGNYFAMPPSRCWLVWRKLNAVPTMAGAELVWTSFDKPVQAIDLPVGRHDTGHPTQKPLALMRWCVAMTEGQTILDPFAGSGTTLLAAKLEGRKAIGIEINERYCEIAAERLRQGVLF